MTDPRSGKSLNHLNETVEYALDHPGEVVLVYAPTYRELEAMRRTILERVPELDVIWDSTSKELRLKNGARIHFASGADSLRGLHPKIRVDRYGARFLWGP